MEKIQGNWQQETAAANAEKHIRELLDSIYKGVKSLFVLAYDNTEGNNQVSVNSFKKYFLPRVQIKNYNIEIDDSIKQYDEARKLSAGQNDD